MDDCAYSAYSAQLLTTTHNRSQLLATANRALQPLKRTGPEWLFCLRPLCVVRIELKIVLLAF